MSYQDAIAGFAQLHQAFRDNADRKKDLLTQQIDINAKAKAQDIQNKFVGEQGDLDRTSAEKRSRIGVGPAHRRETRLTKEYEEFKDIKMRGLEVGIEHGEANVRTLNQDFGIKATDYIMDKQWRAESERTAIDAGLDPDDDADRSIMIAMRALGNEKGAILLADAVAAKDRNERMGLALESMANVPLFQKILSGKGVWDSVKGSAIRSIFGDSEMDSLIELVKLNAINPQSVINQSSARKVDEDRLRFLGGLPYNFDNRK